ncbi:hypothetical protein BFR58_01145 [Helicobacter pylori]|nr:hypothetical protein BFR58_01145 [Helicobacter pylori]
MILKTFSSFAPCGVSSSQNKIGFKDLVGILSQKGKLSVKEKAHSFFNSGKTDFKEHKEFLFIVEVKP